MPLTLRLPFTNIINKYNANRSVYLKKKNNKTNIQHVPNREELGTLAVKQQQKKTKKGKKKEKIFSNPLHMHL